MNRYAYLQQRQERPHLTDTYQPLLAFPADVVGDLRQEWIQSGAFRTRPFADWFCDRMEVRS